MVMEPAPLSADGHQQPVVLRAPGNPHLGNSNSRVTFQEDTTSGFPRVGHQHETNKNKKTHLPISPPPPTFPTLCCGVGFRLVLLLPDPTCCCCCCCCAALYTHPLALFRTVHLLHTGYAWSHDTFRRLHGSHAWRRPFLRRPGAVPNAEAEVDVEAVRTSGG